MRLLLYHNPTAGVQPISADALLAAARAAGHTPVYRSTADERWAEALDHGIQALVVAGGDGTIRQAALELSRRRADLPMVIVPLGTANNIARTFGVSGSPEAILGDLPPKPDARLTVWAARSDWGDGRFIESAGAGVFMTLLEGESMSMRDALIRLKQQLATVEPIHLRMLADDRDVSGDYLLATAMNIGSIGPLLELAPGADPGDRQLQLVRIGAAERPALERYIDARLGGDPAARLEFVPLRTRRLRMDWPPRGGHLDDLPWPDQPAGGKPRAGTVTIEPETAIAVLRPARASGGPGDARAP